MTTFELIRKAMKDNGELNEDIIAKIAEETAKGSGYFGDDYSAYVSGLTNGMMAMFEHYNNII